MDGTTEDGGLETAVDAGAQGESDAAEGLAETTSAAETNPSDEVPAGATSGIDLLQATVAEGGVVPAGTWSGEFGEAVPEGETSGAIVVAPGAAIAVESGETGSDEAAGGEPGRATALPGATVVAAEKLAKAVEGRSAESGGTPSTKLSGLADAGGGGSAEGSSEDGGEAARFKVAVPERSAGSEGGEADPGATKEIAAGSGVKPSVSARGDNALAGVLPESLGLPAEPVADPGTARGITAPLDRLVALHTVAQSTGAERAAAVAPTQPEVMASYSSADRFLAANTPSIVSGVRMQLLPNGGTMTLRLDPPELGALQVAVVMKDGLASVSFSAENGEAARLITSTLSQLRDTLSSAGLTVDRLSVQQSTKPERSGAETDSGAGRQQGQGFAAQEEGARRDQQRRDQLERMWRRASGDDVNVFA